MFTATKAKRKASRNFDHLLDHPFEKQRNNAAKRFGVALARTWQPCVRCSMAKAQSGTVPMTMSTRPEEKLERLLTDLSGPNSLER